MLTCELQIMLSGSICKAFEKCSKNGEITVQRKISFTKCEKVFCRLLLSNDSCN
uniref:Uncharacterized protein n=1 Tax=Anguilla anguilla TaxID=7936 RepID=A0A0E9V1P8_ANGAN